LVIFKALLKEEQRLKRVENFLPFFTFSLKSKVKLSFWKRARKSKSLSEALRKKERERERERERQ